MPDARPAVLVKEPIAAGGVELLEARFDVDMGVDWPAERLEQEIGNYEALIVRSATQVSAELIGLGTRLKVIGRAGTGVDNVDVEAATRRGIIVVNAPGANMVSAAEHAVGLLLAVARNIPQAHAALTAGRWERSRFAGVELASKTLGIVGFGRIGQLVAARARGLGMKVVVYDPFVSAERCRELQVTPVSLEELWPQAEFVTLHAPLTAETRHVINDESIAAMLPGVRIVNAARGELVDIDALVRGLESGKVAGAGLDVFPSEPYVDGEVLKLPNVVVTPHLGASTREAQDRAGLVVAEQVEAALTGQFVSNAVNIPQVGSEDMEVLGPYLPLARHLGRIAVGLCDLGTSGLEIVYSGGLSEYDTRLLTAGVVEGALSASSDEPVNLVNAGALAASRGIQIHESRSRESGDYTNLVTVRCREDLTVAGTTIGREHRPWLVRVYGQQVEIELAPHMLVLVNDDRPGMIGRVGSLVGTEGINIANMNVSRTIAGERAVMVIALDSPPPSHALDHLRELDGIHSVRSVEA